MEGTLSIFTAEGYEMGDTILWVTQYCRLTEVLKGVSAKYMRQFFISVTIPRMMYGADLFLIPGLGISKGTKGFISRLAKIQRQVI